LKQPKDNVIATTKLNGKTILPVNMAAKVNVTAFVAANHEAVKPEFGQGKPASRLLKNR
jgi:hypothetical protein